jgi:diaminopimelate decarboxylase
MDAGVLLTRVTELKAPVELDGRRTPSFVGVDSSLNHVVSALIYETQHPILLGRAADASPDEAAPVTVVGNLMQAGDVLAHDRPLPGGLRVGDVLVVGKTGAYSSRSSARPRSRRSTDRWVTAL